MSPFAATATAARLAPTNPDLARASQLERVVGFESARWLPSLLSELRSLETSGANVRGVGDLRVAHATADNVRRLLMVTAEAAIRDPLPEPALAPFSGGGVALTWNLGNRELTFTVYPEHEDFIFERTDDNDERIQDGVLALSQTDQLSHLITAFLTNAVR
jgi:hypothetical protein